MQEAASSVALDCSLGINSKVKGMWKEAVVAEFVWESEEKHSLLDSVPAGDSSERRCAERYCQYEQKQFH
jgi:hypothetical protein